MSILIGRETAPAGSGTAGVAVLLSFLGHFGRVLLTASLAGVTGCGHPAFVRVQSARYRSASRSGRSSMTTESLRTSHRGASSFRRARRGARPRRCGDDVTAETAFAHPPARGILNSPENWVRKAAGRAEPGRGPSAAAVGRCRGRFGKSLRDKADGLAYGHLHRIVQVRIKSHRDPVCGVSVGLR